MFVAAVVVFMFVGPAASVAIEAARGAPDLWWLVGKWFVFWGVGLRLFTAGVRQIVKPALTAEGILGITDQRAHVVVQELGFANVSIGLIALCSLARPTWALPAAIAGGLFYALAGGKHVFQGDRDRDENLAMGSDLFVAAVMAAFVVHALAW